MPIPQPQIERSSTSSPVSLIGIPHNQIDSVWHKVSPDISRAISYADGKYTLSSIYEGLKQRDYQLWMTDNVTAVTGVVVYPAKKVCNLMLAAGQHMDKWIGLIHIIEEWAKAQGCESIEIYGRPGWEKVLKWERIHTVIRKPL